MPKLHRPYSKIRGTEPSVTTILGLLDKPGLSWAAAKETALFAVNHRDRWEHLPTEQAVDKLRKHHDGLWRGRAMMGTLVHAYNEARCEGTPFSLDAEIRRLLREHPFSIWASMDFEDIAEQALGYILGLEAWWEDWDPKVYASECVVRVPGRYIGQMDMGMRLHVKGTDVLVDVKTTAQQDESKGFYLDSWCLQTAAYAYAREEVRYKSTDKRPYVVETGAVPWMPPDVCAILHLRGDEKYTFYRLPVDRSVHEQFLRLCDVYRWLKALDKIPKRMEIA